MDDEIRKLELETARIRLERERIVLENEQRRRRRTDALETAAVDAAHATKQAGRSLVSLIIDLVRVTWGAFLFFCIGAVIALIAAGLWVAVAPRRIEGDYLYQFGYFMGDGGWTWILGAGVVSFVLILWGAAKG